MFRSFLSADMTYSCAIFPELDNDLRAGGEVGGVNGGGGLKRFGGPKNEVEINGDEEEIRDELEEAQLAKLR
jgi:cyclopropane fatty-acyl-phospholipid synthase-like methyltransferase